ncbi:unnamed protein product [Rotaria sp. Silwood1]|nr:unnamed protein product [Rotaria sp. Silwood1]
MNDHLSVGDRWRIVSLKFDQGLNAHTIAHHIPCHVSTVYNIINLYQETNDVIERDGRDRHMLLNDNEIHTLRQVLFRYPNETSTSIANRFFERTGLNVNPRTIRRYRLSLGFHPVHPRTQPRISATRAQQRLNFCLSHASDRCHQVIFSDEKAFEIDVSGLVYYIPNGRRRPTHFQSQVQHRVAVFGAVWYDGRSDLVVIHDCTNTTTYVQYLEAALDAHLNRLRQYYFIHDRPTWAHTRLAHDWLRNNRVRCTDTYPPVSPDLNAVESVWSWMNRTTCQISSAMQTT